ncbi:MAG: TIGR04283 family arsenosugar biosynthesis glycosyltransferase [Thermoanaerobaculia bacterium]|nr:TIGR04283 family arsenosugar biosynthesis glycosyltransferase [Thermoanaerobaculia bacterium]
MRPSLGVVIPALDEERRIGAAVGRAVELADRVVVADGGSADGTAAVARRAGARVVLSPRGRGVQLNRGAAGLDTDLLLFLHADTELPPEAPRLVREAVAAGHVGGGFLLRWDSTRPVYRLGERIVNLRTRWTRAPLGDQAQFCTREAFGVLGGFREWPVLEDLDFIRRLGRLGPAAVLPAPVTTSTRRFDRHGLACSIARNWLIVALWAVGVPPRRLGRLYHGRPDPTRPAALGDARPPAP